MEQPLLRVSRPVSACSRCRNAKTKCDGRLPACSACERSNRAAECSSANDQFAKGKERSYVASLESKVERLEKQVAQRKRCKSSATTDINSMRTLTPDASTVSGRKRSQRKEASEIDELVSDFGFLSVNATARDFHGFTKEMSFARLVLSTSSVDAMPRYSNLALPPRDIARGLIQKCINEVFIIYPVFSDTASFGSFEAVYSQRGYATPLHWWNNCMILAIAFVSQSHTRDDAMYQSAVRLASSALESAESVIHPGTVAGLQAILLLVIYSMLDPSHFNSWYLIGVASRVMADLGLHQEPAEEVRIKSSQLMLRRRIFYCVYTLDRVISIAHFRAFSFSDDSVNVEPPADSSKSLSLLNAPLVFGGNLHGGITDVASKLLRLRQLQSAWYQTLFQSNRETLIEPWQNRTASLYDMRHWLEDLPITTPIEARNMFLSEILFSSILLLRPPGTHTALCSYGKALLFDYAVEFSEVTLKLCNKISQTYNYSSHIDILRTLFAGRAFLDILRESTTFTFQVTAPQPPSLPANLMAPPVLHRRSFAEHVEEAINTITRLDHILNTLGCRFSFHPAIDNYRDDSDAILQALYARRQRTELPVMTQANGTILSGDQVGLTVSSAAPYQDTHSIARGYPPSSELR